jgi:gliding motility-associated-like protein
MDANSCTNTHQVTVTVETPNVSVNSGTLCLNDPSASINLTATGATSYSWSPALGLSSSTGSSVNCTATATTVYTVMGTTASGCVDSALATVTVMPFFDVMVNSAEICVGESALLIASGADSYVWSPSIGLNSSTGTDVLSSPTQTTVYTVTGSLNGCLDNAQSTVTVIPFPNAEINANPNPVSITNPVVMFSTNANGNTVIWSQDGEFISNLETFTHEFTEDQPGTYDFELVLTNDLGCSDTAHITVVVQDDILFYVPNTFTPDGNEFNQVFQPIITSGIDLTSYQLEIYNRWGERIFQSTNTEDYWDGTYKAEKCQDGTYTWEITFKSKYNSKRFEYVGHVNLLR